ncbi:MAG: hypothetical protein NC094_00360 [Bacteroidales bacterium]|nr:VCBS repeat-containing protein [Lachnoclostridium sp.]MCM1384616.1 VCBS repeat-containing protein [Lachnoclostridium sp.]MCM1463845.1 hypothetical protein [Bacteroidales bacterium]
MGKNKNRNPGIYLASLFVLFLFLFGRDAVIRVQAVKDTTAATKNMAEDINDLYKEYELNFALIETKEDIEAKGYDIIEDQIFPVIFESFGEAEVYFVPAMEKNYHRLAVFLVDNEDNVLYKSNQLETNYRMLGQLDQPTREIAAVSFIDVNHDELTDIVLITKCINDTGEYAGQSYKVGDVLFQGKRTFYRDWRISDKINRFSMNKSAKCIISFVRDGNSTEFLYTAATKDELLQSGFVVIEEQCYYRNFEKLGRLEVVPGVAHMSDYDIFMVYLVNEQGDIIWSFQPMGDYDNLYSLRGITGRDMDGDGMKDLVVLARYSYEGQEGEILVDSKCSIYYQRTGGFDIDTGFEQYYQEKGDEPMSQLTMEQLVSKIREYWGWQDEI